MFQIGKSYIHNDVVLTALSIKFKNSEYTASQFLPDFQVAKETGKYRIYEKSQYFKGAPKKADGAETAEATLAFSEGTYSCYERAIKDIVTDRAIDYSDAPIQPKVDTTEFLTEKILLSSELDTWLLLIGTSGLNQSGYRTVLTASTAWVNGTNPDVLGDLSSAIINISKTIGKRPNLLAFNTEVAEAVAQDDKIVEILKHQTNDLVQGIGLPETLRQMKVVITDALYNAADESAAAINATTMAVTGASFSYVIGSNAVAAFVNPGNPLTLGRNFVSAPNKVATWRDEDRQGQFIKVNRVYSPKITNLGAGWIFTNVKV